MTDIALNLAHVKGRLADGALKAGRAPQDVTLIAVSKTFSAQQIRPALLAGQRVFGENRVQEAAGKWPDLRHQFQAVELHLIGPLQTNKVREAVALFDVIQTLDRPKLARVLADECARIGKYPRLLVQVNTGREPQKAGVDPDQVGLLVHLARHEYQLSVVGLMCIPPADQDPAPHFALLTSLARQHDLPVISMGMSGDYEIAVAQGATHVRVGSAIFGHR